MNKVKAIPDGYHTITPYMIIKDVAGAMEFYKKAFDAKEMFAMREPNGMVRHAEMKMGNSHFMMGEECAEKQAKSPHAIGGTPMHLYVYVDDVDAMFNKAVAAGAKVLHPIKDQFYGDRSCGLMDPYGHSWCIATHVEDVSPEELQKRAMAEKSKCAA